MINLNNGEEFGEQYGKREESEKPYDLSKIEPIAPVPEDTLKEVNNEFGTLETNLPDAVFIPNIAGSPPEVVPWNPGTVAFFPMRDKKKDGKNLKE